MKATMTLQVLGCASYNMESGNISQVFAMVNDPENKNIKGFAVAKMSSESSVVASLPADPAQYPLTADFEVHNKVAGGKLTQHIQRFIPSAKAPKAG